MMRTLLLGTLLAVAQACQQLASDATIEDLQTMINNHEASGDPLHLCPFDMDLGPGECRNNQGLQTKKDITLVCGNDDAQDQFCRINCVWRHIMVTGGKLTLKSSGRDKWLLTGGVSASVELDPGAELVAENVIWDNNDGKDYAAGISATASTLQVTGCEFRNNRGAGLEEGTGGGTIFLRDSSLTVEDSLFVNNTVAAGSGGAIFVQSVNGPSTVSLKTSRFDGNQAPDRGGAIAIVDAESTLTLEDCVFDGNKAGKYGDAIFQDSASTVSGVCGSQFSLDSDCPGSSIDPNTCDALISCPDYVGPNGCLNIGWNPTMDTFREFVQNNTQPTLTLCPFTVYMGKDGCRQHNGVSIEKDLTLICANDNGLDESCIINCVYTHFVVGEGVNFQIKGSGGDKWRLTHAISGSVHLQPGANLQAEHVVWKLNQEHAITLDQAQATITECDFMNNDAPKDGDDMGGGAIRAGSSSMVIDSCRFQANTASTGSGGAIFLDGVLRNGEVSATIRGSQFVGNVAHEHGGAVVLRNKASIQLDNSTFDLNTASGFGDLIYRETDQETAQGLCKAKFSTKVDCPGISSGQDSCESFQTCDWYVQSLPTEPQHLPDPASGQTCLDVSSMSIVQLKELVNTHYKPVITFCPFTLKAAKDRCRDAAGINIKEDTTLICGNKDGESQKCAIDCIWSHFWVEPGATLALLGTEDHWELSRSIDSSISVDVGAGFRAENVTWTDNHSRSVGGALAANDAEVQLSSCTFVGNVADGVPVDGSGGAIMASMTHLSIEDSVFRDNSASLGSGGAIALRGYPSADHDDGHITTSIKHTKFSGNTSPANGGAIAVMGYDAVVNMQKNLFDSNEASEDGDHIFRSEASSSVDGICSTTFSTGGDCKGVATGDGACESVFSCSIDGNSGGSDVVPARHDDAKCLDMGSDMSVDNLQKMINGLNKPVITLCPFTLDVGQGSCKGQGFTISQDTTLICGNYDGEPGVCEISCLWRHFYVHEDANFKLLGTDDHWVLSKAFDQSIYVDHSSFEAVNVTWQENKALDYGGGLAANASDIDISGCAFIKNRGGGGKFAGTGGAIVTFASKVSIHSTLFEENLAASGSGGAVALYGYANEHGGGKRNQLYPVVKNSMFIRNQAEINGGAIALYGHDNHLSISGTTFEENVALDFADHIFREKGRAELKGMCESNSFSKEADCNGAATAEGECESHTPCEPPPVPAVIPPAGSNETCYDLGPNATIEMLRDLLANNYEPIVTLCPFSITHEDSNGCRGNAGMTINQNTTLICGNKDDVEDKCEISCVWSHFYIHEESSLILKGTEKDKWYLSGSVSTSVSVDAHSAFRAENVVWERCNGKRSAGALELRNATAFISECEFGFNRGYEEPGKAGGGGAILAAESSLTVKNSLFHDNNADGGGGAIAIRGYSHSHHGLFSKTRMISTIIESCTFKDNQTPDDGGAIGVYHYHSDVVVNGCTFINNQAGGQGDAIYRSTEGPDNKKADTQVRGACSATFENHSDCNGVMDQKAVCRTLDDCHGMEAWASTDPQPIISTPSTSPAAPGSGGSSNPSPSESSGGGGHNGGNGGGGGGGGSGGIIVGVVVAATVVGLGAFYKRRGFVRRRRRNIHNDNDGISRGSGSPPSRLDSGDGIDPEEMDMTLTLTEDSGMMA